MKNIILIPYRNRKKHLEYFLKSSAPLLKKYTRFKILIIQQTPGKLFNNGKLLNVGFLYCKNGRKLLYYPRCGCKSNTS